jgi:hypothetical protein
MTFFPKALAMLASAALGVAVVLTRLESIDNAVLGSEWECHKTAFVITTCTLRTPRQAVPASLETARADRDIFAPRYIFAPIRCGQTRHAPVIEPWRVPC